MCSFGLFAVPRRLVVRAALELFWEVAHLRAARVVMGIDVALAVPELAAVPRSVAEWLWRLFQSPLLDVGRRAVDRDVARVRLRRACEVDRRLREVEPRLRQADVLDRLRRGDCDNERARVGVADVLGR